MSRRRRRWGSITRTPAGDGWRARAGDEKRTTVGIYLDADHDGREGAEIIAEAALERARRRWLMDRAPKSGRGATLAAYGRKVIVRWQREGTRRGLDRDRATFECHIAKASFAEDPITSIEHRQIQRWIRSLAAGLAEGPRGDGKRKRSRRRVLNVLNVLRAILRHAIEDELIDESPATDIVVPREAKTHEEFHLLDREEVEALLGRTPGARLSLFQITAITVAIFTGMRAGELWGLRWVDVAGRITVRHNRDSATKGGRVRHVPLLRPAAEALERWREAETNRRHRKPKDTELVFPNPRGGTFGEGYDAGWAATTKKRKGKKGIRVHRYRGARAELGIKRAVTFKDLRHTAACALLRGWWVDAGWIERRLELVEIRDWLGHESITTTERYYAKLAPGGLLDVVPGR